ncbi:Fic/DOC family protein [Streptomyces sp. 1114.5]|uniref:Fic family protein n=1 Tax=Streptomyces sp. 1114.5 TaxID=1938830 RepID=UPI000EB3BDCB|nr:Fic family protein [Streptomyces sp. 1114.5]RKT19983.1 Fic/DOC family protein [Streptomyces sp. 1114.5]
MILELAPHKLSWGEVDPARHPFDGGSVEQVVHGLGPARRVPCGVGVPEDSSADISVRLAWSRNVARPWADAMSYALAEHYGRWIVGWRWAVGEGDFDGGPVASWCCPTHSVSTPEETLERVVAAVREWRQWLESLAELFDAHPLDPAVLADQRILWQHAARDLIRHVADRTGGGSGWYGHCRQVLTWFLDRWGVASDVADELAGQATDGRFSSWTSPDTVVVEDVAERLAASLQPSHLDGDRPAADLPDHLERWLAVRAAVAWPEPSADAGGGPVIPTRDGAAESVEAFDRAVDAARADGLLAALARLRADAARGAVLDVELLRGWQQHVLGTPQPPPFRTLPAFAKGGRERYGIAPDTRARLDACLAESAAGVAGGALGEAGGRPLPLIARAARAYLDVCFFHPFDDGNARAAFLTLVFVLAREGVALGDVSLLRSVSFQADEAEDPAILTRYVDTHLRETRRNAATAKAQVCSE